MACILDGVVFARDGQRHGFSVKAWRPDASLVSLRWELRRLLLAFFCVQRSHATKLCNVFRECIGKWKALCQRIGLGSEGHFGCSEHSIRCKKSIGQVEDVQQLEQEYWANTQGSLVLMLHWSASKRDRQQRELCGEVLKYVVHATLSPGDGDGILSVSLSAEHKALCSHGVDEHHEACVCVC